ncbi:hypothetical protein TNCT_319982 [Trichonephila clavata]|uniref:RRM domain-containing protein n=1 Tax=Trichonephila clavata TaxID=2740835 RepID=A0A8X6FZA9_TRICU|nr:hypothetical protein TNCT_319982 [Trichonephila clavata]
MASGVGKGQRTIFIGLLPNQVNPHNCNFQVENEDLKCVFAKYGVVEYVRTLQKKGHIAPRYGFIKYKTEREAQRAVEACKTEGIIFRGRRLLVELANSDPFKGRIATYASQVDIKTMAPVEEGPCNKPQASGMGEGSSKMNETPADKVYFMKTIFVAQLPVRTEREDLILIFSKYGVVTHVRICKGKKENPLGSEEQAKRAIQACKIDRIFLQGEAIQVAPAFHKSAIEMESDGNQGPRTICVPKRVFVGQLPPKTNYKNLVEIFSKYGDVEFAKVTKGRTSSHSDHGYVTFKTEGEAEAAIEAYGTEGISLNGHQLYVGSFYYKPIQPETGMS